MCRGFCFSEDRCQMTEAFICPLSSILCPLSSILCPLSSVLCRERGGAERRETRGASVLPRHPDVLCGHVETLELARRLRVPCDQDARLSALHRSFDSSKKALSCQCVIASMSQKCPHSRGPPRCARAVAQKIFEGRFRLKGYALLRTSRGGANPRGAESPVERTGFT